MSLPKVPSICIKGPEEKHEQTHAVSERLQGGCLSGHSLLASHASQTGISSDDTCRKSRSFAVQGTRRSINIRYQVLYDKYFSLIKLNPYMGLQGSVYLCMA